MRVISVVACAAATAAGPAGARELGNGWEVHEAAHFCYIWLGRSDPGGTQLGLALDANERATIILENPAWQLEADRNYRVTAGIEGATRTRKGRGLEIASGRVALAAAVEEPGFPERFGASPALAFNLPGARTGPRAGRFDLAGASQAVAALRQCLDGQRGKARDLARYKADRETTFRSEPNPSQDPGAPPEPR